jgi:NOL1/NOP2/fmu family ribosome biogenesis protein
LFRKDKAAAAAWSENNIALCAARQRRILAAARSFIRPGGVLIYSTCTFNTQENEENVGWLLGNGEFEEIRLTLDPAWGVSEESFGYRFYPHRVKGEGLYIACLRKTQGEKPRILKDAPFKDWQRLSPKLTNAFREWLSEPDRLEFFSKPNGEIVALPIDSLADMKLLDFALRKRSYGVMIGEMKRNDFIPSHALALSSLISNHLPSVELTLEEVLKFLKKENFHPDSTLKGWMLVKHKGLSLGWIKDLGNRINNYLPNEWRIRMDI